MKKLKLNLQQLGNTEVLTRAQLKTIFGGDDGSGGEAGVCGGRCIGSVGEWEYQPQNGTFQGCLDDIQIYCSSESGSCFTNCEGDSGTWS
jgi:hypothetical protein